MVSLVKKIKNIYKGSYYYANKKYGRYTKRRAFPNFNDYDCTPAGEFSLKEIPAEMNIKKPNMEKTNFEKSNSYLTSVKDENLKVFTEGNNTHTISGSNITSNVSTPVNNEFFDEGFNASPVTTFSDNTDITIVDTSDDHSNSTSFNNSNENDMNIEYNSKNNWKIEMKRYYPSTPKMEEPDNYIDIDNKNSYKYNYNERSQSTIKDYDMGMDMKKKSKWWKKIIPKSKHDSSYSDNTFYENDDDDYGYNPKKYDFSKQNSYNICSGDDYNDNIYNTYNNDNNRYKYNRYDTSLTDGVLVVNPNIKTNSVLF